jgi:membrane protease YdiL (CAAX protease family)
MKCENGMAVIGPGGTLVDKCSLFCRVPWLPRDIIVGVCMVLLWRSLYFIPWTRLENVSPYITWPISILLEMAFFLAYPIWVIFRRVARPTPFFPRIRKVAKESVIAIPSTLIVLIVIALLNNFLSNIFGQTSLQPKVWENMSKSSSLYVGFLLLAYGSTFGPIVEEIFFRGFLFNALVRRCTPLISACFQAFLFALVHPYEAIPSVVVFFLGLILAGIYKWRKTLLAPIFVHAMYNFVGLVFMAGVIVNNANAPVLGVHGTTCSEGVQIDQVQTGSAADDLGIRPGDVIQSYNGLPVTDFEQLVNLVRKGQVGEKVRIQVLRDGTVTEMEATLRRRS